MFSAGWREPRSDGHAIPAKTASRTAHCRERADEGLRMTDLPPLDSAVFAQPV